MKILFDTAKRSDLVCINLYDNLAEEIGKMAEVKYWGPRREGFVNESLDKTIKRLYGDDSPDWVIINCFMICEGGRWIPYKIPPPSERSWKIATFTSDLHASGMLGVGTEGYLNGLNEKGFDATLMLYSQLGYAKTPYKEIDPDFFLKNLKSETFHCPPWISPDEFRPIHKSKKYDATFLGAVHDFQYPLRSLVKKHLPRYARKYGWEILLGDPPPGHAYNRVTKQMEKRGHIVGDVYNEVLSRSKVFIFGCSIYRYPLLKYVEGWGAGTLVMADKPLGAGRMHLESDVNYVEVNSTNWAEKLKYYLEHDEERENIARRGNETVMKYHTASVRAKELLSFLRGA